MCGPQLSQLVILLLDKRLLWSKKDFQLYQGYQMQCYNGNSTAAQTLPLFENEGVLCLYLLLQFDTSENLRSQLSKYNSFF